jgi:hypothetical protein
MVSGAEYLRTQAEFLADLLGDSFNDSLIVDRLIR